MDENNDNEAINAILMKINKKHENTNDNTNDNTDENNKLLENSTDLEEKEEIELDILESEENKDKSIPEQLNASNIEETNPFNEENIKAYNSDDDILDDATIDSDYNEDIDNILKKNKYDEYELNRILDKDWYIRKTTFETHLRCKLSKINQRMRYADNKYYDIKRYFNIIGITILVMSFILTLVEAFLNTQNLEDIENTILRNSVKLIPIILSTSISFFTALIKFCKFEEKSEGMIKAIEKCLYSISEIKSLRESLYFCDTKKDLTILIDKFQKIIYPKYLSNNSDIEKLLTDNDYSKYVKMVNKRDIEHLKINKIKESIGNKINTLNNKYNDPNITVEILEKELDNLKSNQKTCSC